MAIVWRVLLFGPVVVLWALAASFELPAAWNFVVAIGGPVAVFPAVWKARLLLDRDPSPANAKAITLVLHATILALYGPAVIKALAMFSQWHGITIPLLSEVTNPVFVVTSSLMTLTVLNLALRTSGAPFAVALSRRLATDWLYRRTRNPMVLATILWFVSIGLSLQSAAFVLWTLFVLAPAEFEFLRVYEERELEIRFGKDYLEYKAKTPFLWPRLFPQRRRAGRRVKETA